MPFFISIIFFLISNWKSIYDLVKVICDLIKREKDPSVRRVMIPELFKAMDEFNRTGDKGPLQKLLEKIRANRDGELN